MIYFTSDHHFGHAKVIEYCKRPFASVEEMDEELIRRWNERVKPDESVFHLGDFAFGNKEKIRAYRERLNGHITLILGNHDRGVTAMRDCGFDFVQKAVIFSRQAENPGGWEDFVLRHVPILEESWRHTTIFTKAHLCGHVHEAWKRKGDVINVGVDQWGFRPISLEEALSAPADTCKLCNGTGEVSEDWDEKTQMFRKCGACPCQEKR